MPPTVAAVAAHPTHAFSKPPREFITLLAGLGVDGDAHCGVTVKHRSRVAQDPTQPNLRQVHLLHAELFDELAAGGFAVSPGALGENITTRGIDLLALPTAQVWPFPIGQTWPRTVAGRTMQTYHQWMEVTIYATFAGLPAISLPAGFHANGRWPMGLQLIGRPQGDAALLHAAQAYENVAGELMRRRPHTLGMPGMPS